MDFFEAQERAKKRTSRLVLLFILAVLGTIAASYAAAIVLLGLANDSAYEVEAAYPGNEYISWWQPQLLGWVALGVVTIVGIASLSKWLSLRSGGSAVAEMLGARRVDPRTTDLKERQLLNVVEEMAIASGTPLPAVYLLDQEKAINAFAAGLTTSDAVVAVTRGTLDRLTRDELQGVIGHEFSHILNGDMRLNLKLTSVLFGILAIALLGQTLLRSLRFAHLAGAGRRSRRGGGGGGGVFALMAVGFALMVVGYIGYFFGRLIQAAVSRQREYLADAAAVQFTRHPAGISGALKKIGGLALGSRLATPAAAQINHAFFAQNFRSHFGGLFATHPPLPVRIRAIEPQFDGEFIEPPTEVDVSRESFRTAGFGPVQAERMRHEPPPDRRITVAPAAVARSVGLPTPAHVEHARQLLDSLPAELTAAAHDRERVIALVYALLLDHDGAIREKQRAAISANDTVAASALTPLESAALELPARARLPLLQVALATLRDLDPAALDRFLGLLDELVHADARVTPFEYAMQKMVSHHLLVARQSAGAGHQIFSFTAVAEDLAVVLSVLAHESADDAAGVERAYAAGLAQLRMLESPPGLLARELCSIERLDPALQRLQHASLPIKKRLIEAAANVIGADGTIRETEAELLRAICAALDCPMPPLV